MNGRADDHGNPTGPGEFLIPTPPYPRLLEDGALCRECATPWHFDGYDGIGEIYHCHGCPRSMRVIRKKGPKGPVYDIQYSRPRAA